MKIEILEGTYQSASITKGILRLVTSDGKMERFTSLKHVEEMSEEKKKEWGRKIGVGLAVGVLTFGVGGLIAGAMSGNKKIVEFFCELPDERTFLGRTERKGYIELAKLASREENGQKTKKSVPAIDPNRP